MINYLFCLDENYNNQFLTTLKSINDNSKIKFNVYVIHEKPEKLEVNFEKYKDKYLNIEKIKFFQFKDKNLDFPNLKNNHISKATYFRFFIEDYIPKDIETLVYLDCDIVCINNPEGILNSISARIHDEKFTIGVATEYIKNEHTKEVFDRLQLKSQSYFNAGVMVINYQRWIDQKLKNKLLNLMDQIYDKIDFWDQDVLNKNFDGNYLEISNYLNFSLVSEFKDNLEGINRKVMLIHYSGSSKPWTIRGVRLKSSQYFQDFYYKFSNVPYLITTNYKKGAMYDLIKFIFTMKLFSIKNPWQFILISLKTIFTNEK
jgi:lipopolysaccharide biosynthesis glycosyltransferase